MNQASTASTAAAMPADTPAEYRCVCGKLLFKAVLLAGFIEIKCKRCGALRHLEFNTAPPSAPHE